MGQSTDAILFYGYVWDNDEAEMPEAAKNLYGKDEPVLLSSHCSGDYPMPYVYMQSTEIRAWRGSPKPVVSLDVQSDWNSKLTTFIERFEIDTSDAKGPGWFLVSMWN